MGFPIDIPARYVDTFKVTPYLKPRDTSSKPCSLGPGVREEKQAQSIEIRHHLDGKAPGLFGAGFGFRFGSFFFGWNPKDLGPSNGRV